MLWESKAPCLKARDAQLKAPSEHNPYTAKGSLRLPKTSQLNNCLKDIGYWVKVTWP